MSFDLTQPLDQVGWAEEVKTCSRCQQTKPVHQFAYTGNTDRNGNRTRRGHCKACWRKPSPNPRGPQKKTEDGRMACWNCHQPLADHQIGQCL